MLDPSSGASAVLWCVQSFQRCFSMLQYVRSCSNRLRFLFVGRYTITPTTPLPDNEVLVSDSGSFALGFFSPTHDRKCRYIGLWYNKISDKTILWVANRANRSVNSAGVLSVTLDGTLTITDNDSRVVWSSNTTTKLANPVAQLLDNGNLVVRELGDNSSNYAWQGFDYPTDTLIDGMRFGVEFTTGINRTLTAWSSSDDPTPGLSVLYMETRGVPELILDDDRKRIWRSGPWDGSHASGVPYIGTYEGIHFSFVSNKSEVTYSFHLDSSVLSKLVINSSGSLQRLVWVNDSNSWNSFWTGPTESCDRLGICGDYGLCDMDNPVCNCLTGFEPKNKVNWDVFRSGTDGCVRKHKLDCANGTDRFATVKNVKLPQTENCAIDLSLNLYQCEQRCLRSCECTAYAIANSKDSSGCLIWTGNLFDIRNFANSGEDLYVRLAAIDVPEGEKSHGGEVIALVVSLAAVILLIGGAGCFIWQRKKKRKQFSDAIASFDEKLYHEQRGEAIDLPVFDFDTIVAATDCFSSVNKLGEGGFGPVYKAWSLWKDGNNILLVDDSMSNSYSTNEVISCIIIGLLCVQEHPEDRPLMSSVVHMFSSDITSLPQPEQPGFAVKKMFPEVLPSSSNQDSWSCDDMSITIVEPR